MLRFYKRETALFIVRPFHNTIDEEAHEKQQEKWENFLRSGFCLAVKGSHANWLNAELTH